MADEDLVVDLDAAADEGVALDLATRSDQSVALDLDEGAYARLVADTAPIEVGEGRDHYALAERDVVDQPVRRVVRGRAPHSGP
jgi:hypothetical protein